jgi:hypothetical protein
MRSKGRAILEEELGKGNLTCQPSRQAWHKESSLDLGQAMAELLNLLGEDVGSR